MRVAKVDHYAAPNKTLCDYDSPAKPPRLDRILGLARMIGAKPRAIELARSRRGWHMAIIWNRDFEPAQLIALQLLLGSDQNREALNLSRVLCGLHTEAHERGWNILFSSKVL